MTKRTSENSSEKCILSNPNILFMMWDLDCFVWIWRQKIKISSLFIEKFRLWLMKMQITFRTFLQTMMLKKMISFNWSFTVSFKFSFRLNFRECYKKKHESHFIQSSNLLILDKNIDIFEYIKKRNRRNLWKIARRFLHIIRYFFISHKAQKPQDSMKKFTIYIITSVLLVFDLVNVLNLITFFNIH